MSAPIHNHRPEMDPSSVSNNVPKQHSHQPPLHPDRLQMHDSGICSWIGTAFWYVIDCINAVYDWVVMLGWNMLAKIGLVNPPEAEQNPIVPTFAERSGAVKATFNGKTPFEQVEILRQVSCNWNDAPEERQGLLGELIGMLEEGLRDALIAHARLAFVGNEINLENLAEYLAQMDAEAFNGFLNGSEDVDGFAQFKIETLALGWYLDDSRQGGGKPNAQEAHFIALDWIAHAEPHEDFEQHIDEDWMNARFDKAKKKLTSSDREVLLRAYNLYQRVDFQKAIDAYIIAHPGAPRALLSRLPGFDSDKQGDNDYLAQFYGALDPAPKVKLQEDFYAQNRTCREQWERGFDEWLRGVARNDVHFLEILTIATSHVPSNVKRICEEMLEGNMDNRAALFHDNPAWVQRFLDAFINPRVEAQYQATHDAQVLPEIEKRLNEAWVAKQQEVDFDGEQTKEEPFKQGLLAQVTQNTEREYRQHLKKQYLDAGWVYGAHNLFDLIDGHLEPEEIKAAIRASMPR